MIKLLLSFTALAALTSPLFAKEFKLPKEDAVFSIKLPEKWEITYEDETCYVYLSPRTATGAPTDVTRYRPPNALKTTP